MAQGERARTYQPDQARGPDWRDRRLIRVATDGQGDASDTEHDRPADQHGMRSASNPGGLSDERSARLVGARFVADLAHPSLN